MIDISATNVLVKKSLSRSDLDINPSTLAKPIDANSVAVEPSPCTAYLGDLFIESVQSVSEPVYRISYADAVGYEHMEVRKPRNPNVLGYDVFIADFFIVTDEPANHVLPADIIAPQKVPSDRISYADAVGYEFMETIKPRNPDVVGYDVYLGDLFPEEEVHIELPDRNEVRVRKPSYADIVGYEFMETKKPRNSATLGYDVYLGDLFPDEDIAPFIEDEVIIKLSTCTPVRKLSYADAVGYEFMETRKAIVVCYDVFLGDLFKEEYIEEMIDTWPIPKKFSYADAVGYDQMETRRPLNPNSVGYDVFLGDLFAENENREAKNQVSVDVDYIALILNLIERFKNQMIYSGVKVTKMILHDTHFYYNRKYKTAQNYAHFTNHKYQKTIKLGN